jgi:hypothetical protein
MAKYNYYKYIDNLIPKRQQYVERGLRSAFSVADGNLPIMYMKNFSIRKEEEIETAIKTVEDYIRETDLPKHDKFFQKYRDVVEELL